MLYLVLFRLGDAEISLVKICELQVTVTASDANVTLTATSVPTEIGCR